MALIKGDGAPRKCWPWRHWWVELGPSVEVKKRLQVALQGRSFSFRRGAVNRVCRRCTTRQMALDALLLEFTERMKDAVRLYGVDVYVEPPPEIVLGPKGPPPGALKPGRPRIRP